MPFLNDNTLDNGLAALKAAADRIYICSSEPANYTAATSTAALGNKTLAAGGVFPNPIAAGSPSGRQLASVAVSDGSVTASGNATHSAIVTSGSSRVEVTQALSGGGQAVVLNNTFSLTSQIVRLANLTG